MDRVSPSNIMAEASLPIKKFDFQKLPAELQLQVGKAVVERTKMFTPWWQPFYMGSQEDMQHLENLTTRILDPLDTVHSLRQEVRKELLEGSAMTTWIDLAPNDIDINSSIPYKAGPLDYWMAAVDRQHVKQVHLRVTAREHPIYSRDDVGFYVDALLQKIVMLKDGDGFPNIDTVTVTFHGKVHGSEVRALLVDEWMIMQTVECLRSLQVKHRRILNLKYEEDIYEDFDTHSQTLGHDMTKASSEEVANLIVPDQEEWAVWV